MRRSTSAAIVIVIAGLGLALLGSSCTMVQQASENVTKVANSPVVKTAQTLRSTFADITDEEEYYIGRSVAALILSKYNVYENDALTQYVNKVGCAVAAYSDRPETYAGYHFLILNTDEINALAAPGGLIFITKGLLAQCRDEDMLASVLAHEVGHVCAKHGLKAIKQSRLIDAFKTLGAQAAAQYSPADVSKLTDAFQGVLSDIAGQLIEKGYDRSQEYEADGLSVKFSTATGYNPKGLSDFLKNLAAASQKEGGKGWFKTHPEPLDRMTRVDQQIVALKVVPVKFPLRTNRFKQALASMK